MTSLQGKVAIVTGGSRGIGRAICHKLASEGASVVVNYLSNAAMADEVVNTIGDDKALAVKADAANVHDISRLVDETIKKFGKIDIVVASAGILELCDLDKLTEEDFDRHMNINVKGPLFLVQKAAPHMQFGGRIVLFSTNLTVASTVPPNYLAYCMSKGAVEQMVRLLSKNLAAKAMANFIPQKKIAEPEQVASVVAFLSSEGCSWVSGQTLLVNGGQA